MPLKAKITNPAVQAQTAKMSTESHIPKEQSGDDPNDVLFNSYFGARTIELNRPKKLNSLNASMARKIIPRLLEWQKSQLASLVIIGGAGPKAFCAGGDVAALAVQNASGPSGRAASQAYFGLEYQLDHIIATYQKPYIAYLDGITMGGGVGLSVHAPIRIATERTLFAMPETTIGLFPDVGGSFFLPRLEGKIGTYLALTSERLNGVNAFYAGIATHYLDSNSLPELTTRLAQLQFKDYDDLRHRLMVIDGTITEFDTNLPTDEPILLAGELRKAIDRNFRHDSMEDIIASLEQDAQQAPTNDDSGNDPTSIRAWAQRTLQTLSERSPTSLKVTLRQMREGRNWNISETFQHEYHLAGSFMNHPDFQSGVHARLINKPPTTPTWNPPTLAGVTDAQVDQMFEKTGAKRLELLAEPKEYKEYPHRLGLPREEQVRDLVRAGGMTAKKLTAKLQRELDGRAGVMQKVGEIIKRRCWIGSGGELTWQAEED